MHLSSSLASLTLLGKRDTAAPPGALSPMSVPPSQSWDGNDGKWSSFSMQIGQNDQIQDVSVLVSTAGYDVWVVDAAYGCLSATPLPAGQSSCYDSRGGTFNTNESSTWIENSYYWLNLENNLDLNTPANFGYDTVTLGVQGSGLPAMQHQVIATMGSANFWLGMLPLNPQNTNFTNYNDPDASLMQSLNSSGKIPSVSWGYTAGAFYREYDEFGSLTLGGYDSSLFEPSGFTIQMADNTARDLMVTVQGIKTDKGETKTLLPGGSMYTFLDSTVAWLYLPGDACQAFQTAFNLSYDQTQNIYYVTEEQHTALTSLNPSITFTVGEQPSGGDTVDITLPYGAFDYNASWPVVSLENGTVRYFPIRQAINSTQYTLGRAFFQEAYVIADYGRHNFSVNPRRWDPVAQQALQTIYNSTYNPYLSSSSGLSAGDIGGIVVGALVFTVIVGVAAYFGYWWRRNKRNADGTTSYGRRSNTDVNSSRSTGRWDMAKVAPSSISSNSGVYRSRSELVHAQRHEMSGGEHYGKPSSGQAELDTPASDSPAGTLMSPRTVVSELDGPLGVGSAQEMESTARFELAGDNTYGQAAKK